MQQACTACHVKNREKHVYWNTVWEVAKFGTATYGIDTARALVGNSAALHDGIGRLR